MEIIGASELHFTNFVDQAPDCSVIFYGSCKPESVARSLVHNLDVLLDPPCLDLISEQIERIARNQIGFVWVQ